MNKFKSLADDSRWILAMEDRVKHLDKIEQLANQKYLDRLEVENNFNEIIFGGTEKNVSYVVKQQQFLDYVCNLPLKIDRDKIVSELKAEFITNFCNDHNGSIRWLRSIALDMPDLLESILEFFDGKRSFEIIKTKKD